MRNNVTFTYPVSFLCVSNEDGVLSISSAQWFVSLLRRIPGVEVESDLCQEDWGVVVFARRNQKRFWIGLSVWPAGDHAWLAHFHHHSFAWLQRLTAAGGRELDRLVTDFHQVLTAEPAVSGITWYWEQDMSKAHPGGSPSPQAP
jgi:hypothetical protein